MPSAVPGTPQPPAVPGADGEEPTVQALAVTVMLPVGALHKVRQALLTANANPGGELSVADLQRLIVAYQGKPLAPQHVTFGTLQYDAAGNLVVPMTLHGLAGSGVLRIATPGDAVVLLAKVDLSSPGSVQVSVDSTAAVLLVQALAGLTPPAAEDRSQLQTTLVRKVTGLLTSTRSGSLETDAEIAGVLRRITDVIAAGQPLTAERLAWIDTPPSQTGGGGGGGGSAPLATTIAAITPADGAPNTVISITGTKFEPGATVTIGGVAALSVTVNDSTSITATVPPTIGLAGPKDVTVTNPGEAPVTAVKGFTVNPYKVDTIAVLSGPFGLGFIPKLEAQGINYDKLFVACNAGNVVSVIDVEKNDYVSGLGITGPSHVVVDSNNFVAYASRPGGDKVAIFDAKTHAPLGQIDVNDSPSAMAFDPATNLVYVIRTGANAVGVIDAVNVLTAVEKKPFKDIAVGTNPEGIALNTQTRHLYVANGGADTVSVIDIDPNNATLDHIIATITVGDGPAAIAVNETTKRIYVANQNDNTVSVIDAATHKVIGSPIPVGAKPTGIAINPMTNRIYVACQDANSIYVIDGDGKKYDGAGTLVGSPTTIADKPTQLVFNATYDRLYVTRNATDKVEVLVP